MTHWKSLWFWDRSWAEGEECIKRWDGWKASPMHWTWTCANSGRWWGAGRPGVHEYMELQRAWHDRVAKQQRQQQALLREDKGRCVNQGNLFHTIIQDRIFSAPRLCSGPYYKFQMWKALPVGVHQKMVAICPVWCMSFPFTFQWLELSSMIY